MEFGKISSLSYVILISHTSTPSTEASFSATDDLLSLGRSQSSMNQTRNPSTLVLKQYQGRYRLDN